MPPASRVALIPPALSLSRSPSLPQHGNVPLSVAEARPLTSRAAPQNRGQTHLDADSRHQGPTRAGTSRSFGIYRPTCPAITILACYQQHERERRPGSCQADNRCCGTVGGGTPPAQACSREHNGLSRASYDNDPDLNLSRFDDNDGGVRRARYGRDVGRGLRPTDGQLAGYPHASGQRHA